MLEYQKNPLEIDQDRYQSEVEKGPLTFMSPAAREKLKSWGFSDDQLEAVQKFSSLFSYDDVHTKIEHLSTHTAQIVDESGQQQIIIPLNATDYSKIDGDCGTIATRWIMKIEDSGVMSQLNVGRTDGNKVVTRLYEGKSRTHFSQAHSQHVWNGLALVSQDKEILDEVYIDASFQLIQTVAESGYIASQNVFTDIKTLVGNNSLEFSIGDFEVYEVHRVFSLLKKVFAGLVQFVPRWELSLPNSRVIGRSDDHAFVYSLGFVRDKKTQKILSVIGRTDIDAKTDFFLLGESDALLHTLGSPLSSDEKDEMMQLLHTAGKIRFEDVDSIPSNSYNWTRGTQ